MRGMIGGQAGGPGGRVAEKRPFVENQAVGRRSRCARLISFFYSSYLLSSPDPRTTILDTTDITHAHNGYLQDRPDRPTVRPSVPSSVRRCSLEYGGCLSDLALSQIWVSSGTTWRA